MWKEDDEIEQFSEGLKIQESRELAAELSQAYTRLKILEEEQLDAEASDASERDVDELALLRRKIGALEEEIGRRKKNESWPW